MRLDGSVIRVRADADHLRRLWLILLDNAIKYTPRGGRIEVTLAATPECAICSVVDTGIGIAPSDVPHIFQRFYRSDKARKREQGGAGLGLSIAQWIVEAHQANITVDSAPGTGSTFRVRIPQIPVEARTKAFSETLAPVGEEQHS